MLLSPAWSPRVKSREKDWFADRAVGTVRGRRVTDFLIILNVSGASQNNKHTGMSRNTESQLRPD
jgi:hypothetical protein